MVFTEIMQKPLVTLPRKCLCFEYPYCTFNHSKKCIWNVVENLPMPSGGVGLRRGFLLPRVPSPLNGCKSLTIDKGETPNTNGLIQSQEWPVGFSPSGEIVLWDQGEEGDSPRPLGVVPPDLLWSGSRMVLRMKIRPWLCWMPLKKIFIGVVWGSDIRSKEGENCRI